MKNTLKTASDFIQVIFRAGHATDDELKVLRKKMISVVDDIGAKRFVTIMADILKNNFRIEGCNDARVPLKRIFTISLEDLKEAIPWKNYNIPKDHPISFLSHDHLDNIAKLEMLYAVSSEVKDDVSYLKCRAKIDEMKSYYKELDCHIRKEEEVLFPALESSGMKEHPDNLKQEHKEFREILSNVINALEDRSSGFDRSSKTIENFNKKFVPAISNHIFRESFIFYPAALEFITESRKWDNIKTGFDGIVC